MQTAAVAQVVLEGIPLPVREEVVVEYAQRQDARPEVLAALRRIPDRQYMRPDDVGEAIQAGVEEVAAASIPVTAARGTLGRRAIRGVSDTRYRRSRQRRNRRGSSAKQLVCRRFCGSKCNVV